jgi:protein-S-isoprenylcysteine O-methyltransferase Ste14
MLGVDECRGIVYYRLVIITGGDLAMLRILAFLYGLAGYAAAMIAILYSIGFVGDFLVPRSVDAGGPAASLGEALIVNLALLGLFAVQHSSMARRGFKRVWTRLVPQPVERSTYVWFSALLLGLLFWQWRPIPDVVWQVDNAIGAGVLWALFALGWALVFASVRSIDEMELFGVKQVYAFLRRREIQYVAFKTPLLYRIVRHPLYLGFLIAFWAIPTMTLGHLLFAAATTGYILIAVQLEERDLVAVFGEKYREYRQRVPMILPTGRKRP